MLWSGSISLLLCSPLLLLSALLWQPSLGLAETTLGGVSFGKGGTSPTLEKEKPHFEPGRTGMVVQHQRRIGFLWPLIGTLGLNLRVHYGELDRACHHFGQAVGELSARFNLTHRVRGELGRMEKQVCSNDLENFVNSEVRYSEGSRDFVSPAAGHRTRRGLIQEVWHGIGQILGLEEEEDYEELEVNQLELQSRIQQLTVQSQAQLDSLRQLQKGLVEEQAILQLQELALEAEQIRGHLRVVFLALRNGQLPGDVVGELRKQLQARKSLTVNQATLSSVLGGVSPTPAQKSLETRALNRLWKRIWMGKIPMKVKIFPAQGILRVELRLPKIRDQNPWKLMTTTQVTVVPPRSALDADALGTPWAAKKSKNFVPRLESWEVRTRNVFSNFTNLPFVDFPQEKLEDCLRINKDYFCPGVQKFWTSSESCSEAVWRESPMQIMQKCSIQKIWHKHLVIPLANDSWSIQCHQSTPAAVICKSARDSQTLWCSPTTQTVTVPPGCHLKTEDFTLEGRPTHAQHLTLDMAPIRTHQWVWDPPAQTEGVPLEIHQHPLRAAIQAEVRTVHSTWMYALLSAISLVALVLMVLLVHILRCTLKARNRRIRTRESEPPQ